MLREQSADFSRTRRVRWDKDIFRGATESPGDQKDPSPHS